MRYFDRSVSKHSFTDYLIVVCSLILLTFIERLLSSEKISGVENGIFDCVHLNAIFAVVNISSIMKVSFCEINECYYYSLLLFIVIPTA